MSSENIIKFCPNCGTKIIPNAKFCIECGYELALLYKNVSEEKIETMSEENDIVQDNQDTFQDNQDVVQKSSNFEFKPITPNQQESLTDKNNEYENDDIHVDTNNNNFDLRRPAMDNTNALNDKPIKKDFSLLNHTQNKNNHTHTNEVITTEQRGMECPSCANAMQISQKSGIFSKSTYYNCTNCQLTFKVDDNCLVLENEPDLTRFRSKLHLKHYTYHQWKEILDGNYTPEEVETITSWKFDEQTNIQCPACNHTFTKYKTGGFVSYYLVCESCNLILEQHKDEKYTLFNSTELDSPLWSYEKKLLTLHDLYGIFGLESPEKKKQREIKVQEHERRFQEHEKQLKQQQKDMELFVNSLETGNPMLIAPTDTTVVLKNNEKAIYKINNVSLLEPRAVRTSSGGYGGTSVRITKGVTLHSGRTASKSESHDEIKVIDAGDLLITNQRIIFLGQKRTTNIEIKKIISLTSEPNMIQVQRSNKQKSEYFHGIKTTRRVTIEGRGYDIDIDGEMLKKLILGLI